MVESAIEEKTTNTASEFVKRELAKGGQANRLIEEKSPYLLQHAFNPVNWYPWGQEAFERAEREDKPIFLSVGYSTCHWCHVMAHESFEDPATAAILNEHFVSIKVDREERPDVDRIYMAATQAMSGGGGWPMSVFLMPDRRPFYAGTYFPPQPHHGLPGFSELLQAIGRAWKGDRQNITDVAGRVTDRLRESASAKAVSGARVDEKVIANGYRQLAAEYDRDYGGFGREPKFPRPVALNLLLRAYRREGEGKALEMVLATLRKMAAGGMNDQIGGGFHRYSVDRQWRVPHFEKMLYDQAQLASSYLEAFQITGDSYMARTASAVLDYVLRDLTGPHGAFYSAEDADSPLPENPAAQGEGAFYLWSAREIEQLLEQETADIFKFHYGVSESGNALADPHQEFVGKNILYLASSLEDTAGRFGKPAEEIRLILESAARKLLAERSKRPRPHLDDKVITAWNGLMISALAKGYQVLGEERYLKAAQGAAAFLMNELRDAASGTLYRRYREGAAGAGAQLDDYAFAVQGLLDLYEASLDIWWLRQAVDLTEKQIELFADATGGGFYDTSGQDATVLVRMKGDYDGAEPTGNSVAALNLLRLAQITDNPSWRVRAEGTIAAFADLLQSHPIVLPPMAVAGDFRYSTPTQIIIAGLPEEEATKQMLGEVYRRFLPNKILLLAEGGEAQDWLAQKLPMVADLEVQPGTATAYVCQNYVCQLPVQNPAGLQELLDR